MTSLEYYPPRDMSPPASEPSRAPADATSQASAPSGDFHKATIAKAYAKGLVAGFRKMGERK